ncbi:MAG: signal peptidase I [Verrucomicrobiae bacterium]|nr:signal peptidase I [Verrucomicrobiae bacterium]MDW7979203.1 signal peptidase I [Verrucomicrobiales bacterium]
MSPGWKEVLKRVVFGRRPKRTLIRAAVLAVIMLATAKFVFLPVRIVGVSMEPTYRSGSINLINRLAYVFGAPRRGDVVAVRYSHAGPERSGGMAVLRRVFAGSSVLLLKRIIALPGETVAITNGTVYINGEPLAEPYVKARARWQLRPVTLGPDEYFLIGDNRGMDQREHEFGRAEAWRIVGKTLW